MFRLRERRVENLRSAGNRQVVQVVPLANPRAVGSSSEAALHAQIASSVSDEWQAFSMTQIMPLIASVVTATEFADALQG